MRPTRLTEIQQEISQLWEAYFCDVQRKPPSLSDWQRDQPELKEENTTRTTELLQPWLAILEFGLNWLARVHLALNAEGQLGPSKPEFLVPYALTGAACAFGWSLRDACIAGFDTPGRALLRTYVESLLLCVAILHDKSLRTAYQAAESDAEVVNFWHTRASPKNLHKRIIQIETSLGISPDTVAAMTAWRREEYEVMSQSSHLSYLAACMTCFPASLENEDMHVWGVFGHPSANSHRTIGYAARTTWYFSRLALTKVLGSAGSKDSLLTWDQENQDHQILVLGGNVLSRLVLKYWDTNASRSEGAAPTSEL
jgi:hypothetical protein